MPREWRKGRPRLYIRELCSQAVIRVRVTIAAGDVLLGGCEIDGGGAEDMGEVEVETGEGPCRGSGGRYARNIRGGAISNVSEEQHACAVFWKKD